MIRILHILGKRPVGGVGAFLYNMHNNIDTNKIQFDYVFSGSSNSGIFDEKVKKLGGKVYVLPELKYGNMIKYIKELNKIFKNHPEYKVIHGHSPNLGIIYLSLAKIYGVKNRIVHSHSTKYSDSKLKSIRNYFLHIPIKKLSNIHLACSKKAGMFLFNDSESVKVINNSINIDKFCFNEDMRIKLRTDLELKNKFTIGHVGNFVSVKNHKMIIDIFNEIQVMHPDSVLLLLGKGELEEEIKEKVKYFGLDNKVKFLGYKENIADYMNAMDVFLLPSFFEGFPVSTIEAQANGLPCYISDTVSKEIKIINETQFISLNNTPKYWANKILEVNLNYSRYEKNKEVRNAGYDIKVTATDMEKFYLSLDI